MKKFLIIILTVLLVNLAAPIMTSNTVEASTTILEQTIADLDSKLQAAQRELAAAANEQKFWIEIKIEVTQATLASLRLMQNSTKPPPISLKEETFKVNELLKLDGNDQNQDYFDTGNNPIVSIINRIINFAITIMGSIAVLMFILGGFMFMLAQGDSNNLDKAKDILKYATIGLMVALLSYVIITSVQTIFNV